VQINVEVTDLTLDSVIGDKPTHVGDDGGLAGGPETLRDLVVAEVARQAVEKYGRTWDLSSTVTTVRSDLIREALTPVVLAAVDGPVQRTNSYGEVQSGTVTMRELLVAEVRKILAAVDRGHRLPDRPARPVRRTGAVEHLHRLPDPAGRHRRDQRRTQGRAGQGQDRTPGDAPAGRGREARRGGEGLMREAEEIARAFHEAYETLAPAHGYETREASRKPWEDVPEQNRGLMVAVVQSLVDAGVILMCSVEQGTPDLSDQEVAALAAEAERGYDPAAITRVRERRRCRFCGCTDDRACRGGCWWVEPDLCSTCAAAAAEGLAAGFRAVAVFVSAELRHAGVMAGYWLRPYDGHLDRRRWRWQRRGCPTLAERRALVRLLELAGQPPCDCGPDWTGEEPDYRPSCDRHGTTPAALAWQALRYGGQTGERPF
jgi:hypothetical protein